MTRLIDADALCEEFRMRQKAALNWKEGATLAHNEESIIRADATLAFLTEVKLTIDNAPTVECTWIISGKRYGKKEEALKYLRPHGEWVFDKENSFTIDMFRCSRCGGFGATHFKFCPKCGAKMDGGEK